MDSTLPFARGETRFGGDSALCSNSVDKHLEGMRFEVPNNLLPASPTTGRVTDNQTVELVILRNRHPTRRLRRAEMVFNSATQVDVGQLKQAWDHSGTANSFAVPVDDYYTTSIAPGDLFYAVTAGPCQIKTARTGRAFTAKQVVTVDARGRIVAMGAASSSFHQVGVIDRGVSASVTSVEVLVNVGPAYRRANA